MKRRILLSVVLCLCAAIALSGCIQRDEPEPPQPTAKTTPVHYEVEVTLGREESKLTGTEAILFTAPCSGCDQVCLWSKATISQASVDGVALKVQTGDVYTHLTLPRALDAQEAVTIYVQFEMPIVESAAVWQTADYIPLVCAYRDGFLCPPPSAMGDYRAIADGTVDLTIRLPKSMVAVVGGDNVSRTYSDDTQTIALSAPATARPGLLASPYYIRKSATIGGTTWEYYASTVDPLIWQTVQAVAENAHALWGDCPTARVCVVQGCSPDMAGLTGLNSRALGEVHKKVISQWGKASGEPWIAAGIEAYVQWAYYAHYDEATADKLLATAKDNVLAYGLAHGKTGEATAMNRPLDTYDEEAHQALLSDKGLLFWYNLRAIAGDVIDQCVHTLCATGHVDTSTLLSVLRDKTGTDYSYYVDAWVGGKVWIE